MPIYEYRCDNGHNFEVIQRMSDDPVTACEECGAPVQRVFHPVAVHFKGSGFYNTDYKNKSTVPAESKSGGSDSSSSGDSSSSSSNTDTKSKSDSKSDSGSKSSESGGKTKSGSGSD
jgi:putative FmdB family regulatory protein